MILEHLFLTFGLQGGDEIADRGVIQTQVLPRVLERADAVQEFEPSQVIPPRSIPLPFEQAARYFWTKREAFSTVFDFFRIASDLFRRILQCVRETEVGREVSFEDIRKKSVNPGSNRFEVICKSGLVQVWRFPVMLLKHVLAAFIGGF